MKSRRTWWFVYILCALGAGAGLFWISIQALNLERAEHAALAEADHEEAIRLALWRMDSWFAPLAAGEASRPAEHYRPLNRETFAPTPSPLAQFESQYIRLHFEYCADYSLSSPQLAMPPSASLPGTSGFNLDELNIPERLERRAQLDRLAEALATPEQLDASIALAEAQNEYFLNTAAENPQAFGNDNRSAMNDMGKDQSDLQLDRGNREAGRRAQSSNIAQQQAMNTYNLNPQFIEPETPVDNALIGPLHPVWLHHPAQLDGEPMLILARRTARDADPACQGVLMNWPAVHTALLEQINDLFPEARLGPLVSNDEELRGRLASRSLASLPAVLDVPPPIVPEVAGLLSTPTRIMLAICWPLLVFTLLVVGLTLRASIVFGERRARFASAVTHELRTPLTTFRMYSDMLASGMVTDEQQKREYLDTLKRESDRLATLVENVLAYSRIERGVAHVERRTIGVQELLDRVRPMLDQRAAMSDMALEVRFDTPPDCAVSVDQDAIAQILLNLIDNACKYGHSEHARRIELIAVPTDHGARIIVQDHGPGVPAAHAASIFRPFDRGAAPDHGPTPGIGLGLALGRGLARQQGGDLTLAPAPGAGARFELALLTE